MINNFFVTGINYRKSDSDVRSKYALTADQCAHFYKATKPEGVKEFFILSTCNRTEIYGIADSANQLISIFHPHQQDIKQELTKDVYIKQGWNAVKHLFEVAAGLDSQLIGDYEIMGQVKQSFLLAKENSACSTKIERIVMSAFASAKDVRTQTLLSSGTVSTSYAAVRFIKKQLYEKRPLNILVVGAGEIGSSVCRNLKDYFPGNNVTIVNRSLEKAQSLAVELKFSFTSIANMQPVVETADIIVTATASPSYLITNKILPTEKEQLIIDMSMPRNVQPLSKTHSNKKLLNIDDISKIKDTSLQIRNDEVPKAQEIIDDHILKLKQWEKESSNRKLINNYKQTALKLEKHLYDNGVTATSSEEKKQFLLKKNVQQIALNISNRNDKGCFYLETLGKYFDALSN